ncbi:MAG: radical SAM family heme chaperone HemW [Vicinamibacterales bacterium]
MDLGLYIHVPFCRSICNYCNFNRGLFDEAVKTRYVSALLLEIERAAEAGASADTIFFGGGTPSLLTPAEIGRIVERCAHSFDLAADAEVTLEANPETVTPETLAGYRAAGVSRLSFGVQSFADRELARLERRHSAARAVQAVGDARRAGFDNISLDLMMWLPGQQLPDWLRSVDALVDLGPEHVSFYLLELYPNAPLRDEMARRQWSLAPDDDAAAMYLEGLARLDAAGYGQYEISNAARPGRESRHNLKYWTDGNWHGFGCGAHGTRDGIRWRNVSGTSDYCDRVEAGTSPVAERRRLPDDERLGDALFTGLRLTAGLDLAAVENRYGVDVWSRYSEGLSPFVEAGVLVHEPGRRLALTRDGMLVANEVMMVFIGSPVR